MLPTLAIYRRASAAALAVSLAVVMALVAASFHRNNAAGGVGFTLLFVSVACSGVAFLALQESVGGWALAGIVPKIGFTVADGEAIRRRRTGVVSQMMVALGRPHVGGPVIGATCLGVWFVLSTFVQPWSAVGVWLVTCLLLPVLVAVAADASGPMYALLASNAGVDPDRTRQAFGTESRRGDVVREATIIWGVTMATILPVEQRSDFSRANGYLSPEFVVAVLVLCEAMLCFVLLGARRTRVNSVAGEVAVGSRNASPTQRVLDEDSFGWWPLLRRWGLLSGLWSVGLCVAFRHVSSESVPFYAFLVLLSVPVMAAFVNVRGRRIDADTAQAQKLIMRGISATGDRPHGRQTFENRASVDTKPEVSR